MVGARELGQGLRGLEGIKENGRLVSESKFIVRCSRGVRVESLARNGRGAE